MQVNFSHINKTPVRFKGYDAVPLKKVYMSEKASEFHPEVRAIGEKEGYNLVLVPGNARWIQDYKFITRRNGEPCELFYEDWGTYCHLNDIENCDIKNEKTDKITEGGNFFVGKHPDGKKWLMIGVDSAGADDTLPYYVTKDYIKQASKIFEVAPENIYFIPKPNFHLDMGIRPIGDNDVLVNDYSLVETNLRGLDDYSDEFLEYLNSYHRYDNEILAQYATCNKICNTLRKHGFNPIRIAGVYGKEVNFMNALVNKHDDNSVSYITNSSKCYLKFYSEMQKLFEKELREKVGKIRDVYFVEGDTADIYVALNKLNEAMKCLYRLSGGIHCMTLEEPDFDRWA